MADETPKTEKKVRMVALDLSEPEKFILTLRDYSNSELAQVMDALSKLRDSVHQCGRGVLAEMERRLPDIIAKASADPTSETDPLKRELLQIARDAVKSNADAHAALADLPVGDKTTWH